MVPLLLGFSIGQGGHTGEMLGVALTFVVLQQEQVPLSRARTGTFARGAGCQLAGVEAEKNPVPLATWWLHGPPKEKPRYLLDSGVSFTDLVPER